MQLIEEGGGAGTLRGGRAGLGLIRVCCGVDDVSDIASAAVRTLSGRIDVDVYVLAAQADVRRAVLGDH